MFILNTQMICLHNHILFFLLFRLNQIRISKKTANYFSTYCQWVSRQVQSAVMKLCAQDVKQSNHATIQSLVHLIGIVADVPAPCCVADRMWSLPVLYVDHDDSVVLTVYEDAVVRSCICR